MAEVCKLQQFQVKVLHQMLHQNSARTEVKESAFEVPETQKQIKAQ